MPRSKKSTMRIVPVDINKNSITEMRGVLHVTFTLGKDTYEGLANYVITPDSVSLVKKRG